MSIKIIGVFVVVGMVAGGLLVGAIYGPMRYNRGFQDGVATKPTVTETTSDLTGEDILRIREQAVKEYIATRKGKIVVSQPDKPPVTIDYDETETTKGYEVMVAELYEEFNQQLAEKNKEIYDLKNTPQAQTRPRKFGLGLVGGYIYPKMALAGLRIEWGKTMVIPLAGWDWEKDGVKYGGLVGFRF